MKRPKSKFVVMKKCPFCDGHSRDLMYEKNYSKRYYVYCNREKTCTAMGPTKKTRQAAIIAWNKPKRINEK